MTFIFVRTFATLDGTITSNIRIGKALKELGHTVFFLTYVGLEPILSNEINQHFELLNVKDLSNLDPKSLIFNADIIQAAVDGDYIAKVYDLKKTYFNNAAVIFVSGASNSFIHRSKIGWSPDGALYKSFLNKLPAKNMSFIVNSIKNKHLQFLKNNHLSESPIIKNSLLLPKELRTRLKVIPQKLVSISRLAPAREYVMTTIDVIKKLREQNIFFDFHIYGNGEYYNEIKKKIKNENLEQYIFLHGEIPNSQVPEVLAGATFFIGAGIAIVEAAAYGIPSILSIEYNTNPTVYGWFNDITDGSLGEFDNKRVQLNLIDLLEQANKLTAQEYEELSIKNFAASRPYSIDVIIQDYIQFAQNADKNFNFKIPKLKRVIIKLLRQPFKLISLPPSKVIKKS